MIRPRGIYEGKRIYTHSRLEIGLRHSAVSGPTHHRTFSNAGATRPHFSLVSSSGWVRGREGPAEAIYLANKICRMVKTRDSSAHWNDRHLTTSKGRQRARAAITYPSKMKVLHPNPPRSKEETQSFELNSIS